MKHKEIVRAWLDGAVVQKYDHWAMGWNTLPTSRESDHCLSFSDYSDFRIKPEVEYSYINIYAQHFCPLGEIYESPAAAEAKKNKDAVRSHILKIGSDGSAELIAV